MVVELVADVQDGRRDASPGQLLRAATPVLGQLILVGIVAAIGIVIGFVLIIVPGLILHHDLVGGRARGRARAPRRVRRALRAAASSSAATAGRCSG